jgi:hypothetical protein
MIRQCREAFLRGGISGRRACVRGARIQAVRFRSTAGDLLGRCIVGICLTQGREGFDALGQRGGTSEIKRADHGCACGAGRVLSGDTHSDRGRSGAYDGPAGARAPLRMVGLDEDPVLRIENLHQGVVLTLPYLN